ncbi:MAG: PBP1A family penicillin-binding protein [Alphaproteobacteria bacterium]|nr:PBP1A family penicillin-binding protein [Alphaproteobacteria bacterium]
MPSDKKVQKSQAPEQNKKAEKNVKSDSKSPNKQTESNNNSDSKKSSEKKTKIFKGKSGKTLAKSILRKTIKLSICIFSISITGYLLWCWHTLPDVNKMMNATREPNITFLYEDGSIMLVSAKQSPVKLKSLPKHLIGAVVATEDKRFYTRGFFDVRSFARAIWINIIKRDKAQGGSTITQQVVKNIFLTRKKTIQRKIQELMLAWWLERNLTRDQILEIYLNRMYFGAGAYGIEAAARKYYGISAKKLSLYQSATLAGLLKAPSSLNPISYPEKAHLRARIVLAQMVKAGLIKATTGLEVAEIGSETFKNKSVSLGWFTDYISDEISGMIGSITGDITVHTTMSKELQEILSSELFNIFKDPKTSEKNITQASGIIMDTNGAILAMIGGKDYKQSAFNRAVSAKRQIGSTIKPFIYLSAFEKGFKPSDTIEDTPLTINGWSPKNSNGKYYGLITYSDALTKSVNTAAIRIAVKLGLTNVLKTARKFGIVSSNCKPEATIALGVCNSSLLNVAGAYASLANSGIAVHPFGTEKVIMERNKKEEVVYNRNISPSVKMVKQDSLSKLQDIMYNVIQNGTGKKARTDYVSYGKTGTTQNYRDAWFVGWTDVPKIGNIVIGIWMGNDDEKPMNKVSGGDLPAITWGKIVKKIRSNKTSFNYEDD